MHTVVDGTRWRLRFLHYFAKPGQHGKKGRKGTTTCFVERWEVRGIGGDGSIAGAYMMTSGWVPEASGMAVCGRSERGYDKEIGRQFSLIRALRSERPELSKEVKSALVTAYIHSAKDRRVCADVLAQPVKLGEARVWHNLYEPVFSDKPFDKPKEQQFTYEGEGDAA